MKTYGEHVTDTKGWEKNTLNQGPFLKGPQRASVLRMWTKQSLANSALPLAACKQPSTTQEFEQVQLCSNKLYLQRQAKGQIQSASYIAESWSNRWKIKIPAVKEKNMHKQFFKRLWHRDIGRHREQTLGTVGGGRGRRNWESSTEIHTCSFSSVQSLSRVQLFGTPWAAARQASSSTANSQSLLKLMSIDSVMPSKNLILCHPLLFLPSNFPSVRVFSNESALHIRWPKYRSFSFSISPSNEYSGLISCRMDWLDLLAVQGTLKGLLQHHSSKHQFFGAQLSSESNSHIHTWSLEKP